MTLDGTNTWVFRAPTASASVVVDPGPADEGHIDAIVGTGPIEAIFVTHRHLDHAGGLDLLTSKIDVPVRAMDPAICRDAPPLQDGDVLTQAGLRLEVIATPGHTSDSMCLLVSDDADDRVLTPRTVAAGAGGADSAAASAVAVAHDAERAVFTGDTILGRGTTIVAWPDGDLGNYLSSLVRLGTLAGVPVLPGHGPDVADCAAIASAYLAHRLERLDQVRAALADGWRSPADVVAAVYPDLEPQLVPAAEWTVRAALAYLDAT
jgi:glyoxylase-like metal-dependent hydrolase (beta-lactamase superfamily II)